MRREIPIIEAALAEALVRAHDPGEAIPLLERLTRERPDDGSLLFMYGDALLQSQRIDGAIPVLERRARRPIRRRSPHRRRSGRAYVLAGKYEEALPHLEVAAKQDEDGDMHLQLARAFQALQRADAARRRWRSTRDCTT